MRSFELAGRSTAIGHQGMAATSHPLATLTALDVLRAGGNALDAAVAACAVQCVVEPQSTGIGGDCFALIAGDGGDVTAYNGSGRAPAKATVDWYAANGIRTIEPHTAHAVTVPGAVDAWDRLVADHGTRPLAELLRPAIRYARDGYPVHPRVAFDWRLATGTLRNDPSSVTTFMPNGETPAAGAMHRQPALAATLERIANDGRNAFYRGPVAEDIVAHLRSRGGLHTLEDFAEARGEYVTPVSANYRGFDIYECPPNGQGMIALLILRILAGLPLADLAPLSPERLHLMIEATRLAYHDRNAFVADPAQARVPVDWLLSDAHAADLRAAIDPIRALPDLPPIRLPPDESTVYLCVVDKNRMAVSLINSLFRSFGTGLMAPRSGVLLQNRGSGFVIERGHPNAIAPRKRPLHTIIPGMALKKGQAVMPFGVMGGQYQAMGHAYFLSNLLDHDLDVQEAIDLPRLFPTLAGPLEIESGVPENVRDALARLGHKLVRPEKPIGGGQAIWIDFKNGTLIGGSDPRKDGLALGY